ncbi:MAG TPA: aminotransferase class I/II-fold pyridoxal phosphate-dependent enzyme [Beijerinckiaceae bacterium]|nr:aminotransferase class I/II-fold pyridoxal phosphate-dependent enzyme [Beijerinckiaceae bacterium]
MPTDRPPPSPAARSDVAPFIAMDVMAEAGARQRLGEDVVSLAVGEPGGPPPRAVREAVSAALAAGRVPYTDSLGLPALRERIAKHYAEAYNVAVPASRVAVTTGSSGGFILSFLAMFDVGDRIAIPRPGYPAYRNILQALGLVPVEIPTAAATRYALTGEMIAKAHEKTPLKGALVMSPANPTGVTMAPAALQDVAETCRRLGLWLISDEIYHGLVHAGDTATALAFSDDAVVVNSFSKYYCMTGWRVGWLILPERLVRPVERLAQSLAISVPYLSQIAGQAALGARAELEAIKASYARNRGLLAEALPKLGLPVLPMDGAFYAYVDVSRYSNDSMDFSRRALREAGVALTPGVDFDREEGHRAVRISYAGSEADIATAVARLETWLRSHC